MAEKSTGGDDYKQQIVRLWAASLVVAILFFVAFVTQVFFLAEETEIRRESYVANLEQFYQQEIQECFGATPGADGSLPPTLDENAERECLERVNETGRYAQLIEKWGGSDILITELPN